MKIRSATKIIGLGAVLAAVLVLLAVLLISILRTGEFKNNECVDISCQEYTGKVTFLGHGMYRTGYNYNYLGWYVKLGNETCVMDADSNLAMNVITDGDTLGESKKEFRIEYWGNETVTIYSGKEDVKLYHIANLRTIEE